MLTIPNILDIRIDTCRRGNNEQRGVQLTNLVPGDASEPTGRLDAEIGWTKDGLADWGGAGVPDDLRISSGSGSSTVVADIEVTTANVGAEAMLVHGHRPGLQRLSAGALETFELDGTLEQLQYDYDYYSEVYA